MTIGWFPWRERPCSVDDRNSSSADRKEYCDLRPSPTPSSTQNGLRKIPQNIINYPNLILILSSQNVRAVKRKLLEYVWKITR